MTEIAAASSAPATPLRPLLVALGLLAVSGALCIIGYLAWTVQGSWLTSAPTLHWKPSELSVARGKSELRPDSLALLAPDASGTTLVSITTSLRSSDYRVVAWEASGVPADVEAALLWHTDYEPARLFNRRLEVEAGRIRSFPLENNAKWIGTIDGLALGLQGSYTEPIVLRGLTVKTLSAREIVADRLREWFAFEQWNGSSINTIIGGADVQPVPMPFALAVAIGLAALMCVALSRWWPQGVGRSAVLIVGAMFAAAWFALDARWQWNLARQVAVTADRYAGKSWRERHLAAEDRALFEFIEEVRAKLPPPPARVFMVADASYERDRGAYHLYPYNVFYDPATDTMPPASAVRPGDFMVVYHRKGVQYDAALQRLRWDGAPSVPAQLLLAQSGAALFRIL